MSAIRRFMALEDENSVFVFTIDTTKIVSGATNGSENPLTFRLPIPSNANNLFFIQVSDGRPNIPITGTTPLSGMVITFATAGIYTIKLIGRISLFNFNGSQSGISYGHDKLKIISIDNWGTKILSWGATYGAFDDCTNLVIKANNTLVLPANSNKFFRNINGFETSLNLLDTSKVTSATFMLENVITPLKGTLNPFWLSIINFGGVYTGNTFDSNVNKIEIKSDTLDFFSTPWSNVTFQNTGTIELICDTPNLTKIYRIFQNGHIWSRCHGGKIDVRKVNTTSNWLTAAFPTTAQVDATLLGWAQLPFMQAGVTWNWANSKYSNNPAVIAALNKITNDWGVIFTNLTMA